MVTIPSHPDAAGEGAEGIAVVAAAVLLQELLVVNLCVLELVGAVGLSQPHRIDALEHLHQNRSWEMAQRIFHTSSLLASQSQR